MSEIQILKDWELKNLEDVFKIINDQWKPISSKTKINYLGLENIESDSGKLVKFQPTISSEIKSAKNRYSREDVLYGKLRPYLNKVYLPDFEGICSTDIVVLRPRENILRKYLGYFLRSQFVLNPISKKTYGTKMPRAKIQDLGLIKIPLPGKEIQKKIVQKLDYIFTQLEEKKNAIFSLIKNNNSRIEFFEKNWMAFIISKEIENHPHRKEWEVHELKDLTNDIGDGMHSTPNYVQNSDFYFINGNNLKNGSIAITEKTKMIDKAEYQKYKLELNEKTVLLSINGTIGNLAFYRNEKVILGKSACYINCNNRLDPEFLFYLLQSTLIKNYFRKEQTHTSIYNLSLKSIRKTPIMFPSLPEQKKIIQRIKNAEEKFKNQKTQFQNIKNNYENIINYVIHTQSSILNAAFSGKLVN